MKACEIWKFRTLLHYAQKFDTAFETNVINFTSVKVPKICKLQSPIFFTFHNISQPNPAIPTTLGWSLMLQRWILLYQFLKNSSIVYAIMQLVHWFLTLKQCLIHQHLHVYIEQLYHCIAHAFCSTRYRKRYCCTFILWNYNDLNYKYKWPKDWLDYIIILFKLFTKIL